MKHPHNVSVGIPEGITCDLNEDILTCKKGDIELKKKISVIGAKLSVDGGKISLNCAKANKRDVAIIKSNLSHVKNMLQGLEEKFVYNMEVCNVHFPMSVKVEGSNVVIGNFLGSKINRLAKILDGVEIEVKGKDVTVSGHDLEKTGQTAANIEKATRVPKKDRRVFQDGIFLVKKPKGEI
jgi:large subunit ribosomal protein L6